MNSALEIICVTPIKIQHRSAADAWTYLEQQGLVRMRYCEFGLAAQTQWILRGKEHSPIWRVGGNVGRLAHLLLSRGKTVLLGSEPFRAFTFAVNRLKARHRCIYHGSWPWDAERFDRGGLDGFRKRLWERFFKGMPCVSPYQSTCDILAATYGAEACCIPWSVDTEVFRPPAAPPARDKATVLFVGELWELKGIRLILDMIRQHPWNNAKFVFVGRGKFEGEIKSLARNDYPVESLGFIASRKELAAVMQNADLLILPSIRVGDKEEKFGTVLIEAGACGLPVIASDCVGPRQIVQHGQTGILIPQNDGDALRKAVLELVNDPPLRARLGRNGRRNAEQNYDVKVVARQWLSVFRKAAACSLRSEDQR